MNTNKHIITKYTAPFYLIFLAIVVCFLMTNSTTNRSIPATPNEVDRSDINKIKPQTIEHAEAVKSNDGWIVTGSVDGEKVSYYFSDTHNLATLSQSGQLVFYQYGNQIAVDKAELG